MKDSYRLRKLGVTFALPVSIALWAWHSFDVFRHAHFRITYLFGMLFFVGLIYAIIKSYRQKEDGCFIWFAGLQCWYWAAFDYVIGVFLGHYFFGRYSIVWAKTWAVQVVGIVIALSVQIVLLPLVHKLHAYNKRKRNQTSHSQNRSKTIGILVLIVGAVSALRHVLLALTDPVADFWITVLSILFVALGLSIASLFCLVTYLTKEESVEQDEPTIYFL